MSRLRTLLFVPAVAEAKIAKALASNADVVILDLEDAIAPDRKDDARSAARAVLQVDRTRPIAVRVNAQGTIQYRADLLAVMPLSPDYVMLPKCGSVADLVRFDHEASLLEHAAGRGHRPTRVLPLVSESAAALLALDYRGAPSRTAALCFAAEDLATDLGIIARAGDGGFEAPVATARAAVVTAARAAGLQALDTPFPDPRRPDLCRVEAAEAAAMGYTGKLCIHPDQLSDVSSAFAPPPDRVRWAQAVVDGFGSEVAPGVITVDGRMVDRAHLPLAERILEQVRG